MLPKNRFCTRVMTALALLVATAIPAVGLDAQRAHACPLLSDCPPGTPWHPKAESVESYKGSPGIQVEWTNTATDEHYVAFEIHRRERQANVFVDISPDVTNIMKLEKQVCYVRCGVTPVDPGGWPPAKGLGSTAKPLGVDVGAGWFYAGVETSYSFWGLPYGSEHGFRIRAKNLETGLVGEWSEEVFASVGYPSFSTKPSKPNPNPPTGPLILSTSFKDQGVELMWLYDVDPPTSFMIYREGKPVANPSMRPSLFIEDTHPSPWTPPGAPPDLLGPPPVYQAGIYVLTDVFQYSLAGQYAYKVCPVFGGGGGSPGEIKIEGACSAIVRTPVGPLGLSGSWDKGAQLTWAYDVNPPTAFRIYRDGKLVGDPGLAPEWITENVTPNPWSPPSPPSSALTTPPVYQTGVYLYTDVFDAPPFSTFSYKVCPVFGEEPPTEGTCSASVAVSNYGLVRVERPEIPPNPGVVLAPGE